MHCYKHTCDKYVYIYLRSFSCSSEFYFTEFGQLHLSQFTMTMHMIDFVIWPPFWSFFIDTYSYQKFI